MRPPEEIPQQMLEGYSMGGIIPIRASYRDDSHSLIQDEINKNYTKEVFEDCFERISRGQHNYYGATDLYLYNALDEHPIVDQDVCVIGSTHPWYETMCLHFGARSVTVIEYSERKSFHEKITYLQPHEGLDMKFDSCFSISSFEHDGLGRYGDPLNPNGDLEAMQKMKDVLKPEGVMFLAVPVGIDTVWFNVHRIYGEHRFHELIKGWNVLDRYGFHALSFDLTINDGDSTTYQPVVVLENSEVS
jgi:SAM-dependent methyltransferase